MTLGNEQANKQIKTEPNKNRLYFCVLCLDQGILNCIYLFRLHIAFK